MLHYLYTYPETIVDGDGIRFSIYLSGCRHHCRGCHNPESWNPASGHPLTREKIEEFIEAINSNPLLDGITFSGGDPFYSPEDFLPLSRNSVSVPDKISGAIPDILMKNFWKILYADLYCLI